MGKYMRRKSKTTREVSLMEVPSLGGVLTRAKTLALQKSSAVVASIGTGSYIQLRSRRLVNVKPASEKKQKESGASKNPIKASLRGANSSRLKVDEKLIYEELEIRQETEVKGAVDLGINDEEGSFGETMFEMERCGRTTRETTPCSLIKNPDIIQTPGSSTKPNSKNRVENTKSKAIPSTSEMDEFFTGPEKHQQRLFMEKYNFDPVNEKPLNGRYEWVKVDDDDKKS